MKLLIVDDSSIIRRTIESAYKDSVFTEIDTASDGMMALEKFNSLKPDVVTLDITMPHLSGLAALAKMMKINPNVSVLTISALADHHTAIKSLELGAHQFICKPFDKDDLKAALDDLLKDKQLLDSTPTAPKEETPEVVVQSAPRVTSSYTTTSTPASSSPFANIPVTTNAPQQHSTSDETTPAPVESDIIPQQPPLVAKPKF